MATEKEKVYDRHLSIESGVDRKMEIEAMNSRHYRFMILLMIAVVVVMLVFPASFVLAADTTNYASLGRVVGSVVGLLLGVYALFRVHPILGVIGLIAGIAAIARMLG